MRSMTTNLAAEIYTSPFGRLIYRDLRLGFKVMLCSSHSPKEEPWETRAIEGEGDERLD